MSMNIMDAIATQAKATDLRETENGALAFSAAQSDLVDFFYKISSFRQMPVEQKQSAFLKALAEDEELAYRMLFFARDIRGGLGERQLFRDIVRVLPENEIVKLLPLFPEYGRWDDVLDLLGDVKVSTRVRDAAFNLVETQLAQDKDDMAAEKPISLLAKWMPSLRKVSRDKMALAKLLVRKLGIQERDYRHLLSQLRGYLKVVEKSMTKNEWTAIDFGAVPSKAAKNYRKAFAKHDATRYNEYLSALEKGEAKVNAAAVFPYEIVSAYRQGWGIAPHEDVLLEQQWKALPLPKGLLENAIVVRDGSGSMNTPLGTGKSQASDVATALSILMAEHLKGPYANRFISFSETPKFVDLGGCTTLRQKLIRAFNENECANTNIERTMQLILQAAVKNGLKQSEIPTVIIISDMEFDEARGNYSWYSRSQRMLPEDTLFETIRKQWDAEGYDLPRIVFWNVCSRTATVPMQENKNGLLLVSGFSQSIMDMLSGEGSMIDMIRKKLSTPRYDKVIEYLHLEPAEE